VNLQNGRVVVPSRGGQVLDQSYAGLGADFSYPLTWQAQMLVYEGAQGSALLYSTDGAYWFKRLRMTARGSNTIDIAIGTDSTGSFAAATGTPQVQWRLKSFAGNWQQAAGAYRTWLNSARPPVS
jgi:hypothetical protein